MNIPSKPFGPILFFSLICLCCISCSDAAPKITSVNSTFIIDFEEEGQKPRTSLSVFVQDENSVNRLESMQVTHLTSGLKWKTSDLSFVIGKNGKNWAGYSDFIFPESDIFPQGTYEVVLEDKAGELAKSKFSLNTPEEVIQESLEEYQAFFKTTKLALEQSLAIYDQQMNLLYSGEMLEEFSSAESILAKYQEAYQTRKVYQINGGNILLLFPPEILNPEAQEASEGDN